MNKNNDLSKFKLQIFKYTLIAAIIFGLGSLPVLGLSVSYLYGLALGTCVGIFGFNILIFISKKVLNERKAWLAPLGYFIRLPIYGFAFYLCFAGYGFTSGIGCILGIMSIQVSIIYVHGIKSKLTKGKQVDNGGDKEE
jgi:hypothetical protein